MVAALVLLLHWELWLLLSGLGESEGGLRGEKAKHVALVVRLMGLLGGGSLTRVLLAML